VQNKTGGERLNRLPKKSIDSSKRLEALLGTIALAKHTGGARRIVFFARGSMNEAGRSYWMSADVGRMPLI